jgi:hypothetical protein
MRSALGLVFLLSLVPCCKSGGTTGSGGGGASDPNCPAYVVPTATDLKTPSISFKSQVMPIFNANCGATNCHGNGASSQGNLFLGSETAKGSDSSMVRKGLIGTAGVELALLPLVTPGDPTKSYLMHKLDGDQCLYNAQCANMTCMAEMPSGLGHPLPVANRDTIRRWIAQGALDN